MARQIQSNATQTSRNMCTNLYINTQIDRYSGYIQHKGDQSSFSLLPFDALMSLCVCLISFVFSFSIIVIFCIVFYTISILDLFALISKRLFTFFYHFVHTIAKILFRMYIIVVALSLLGAFHSLYETDNKC